MNEWLDWAVKQPGPPNKVYPETNERKGIICHSMEGWLAGSLAELQKPERMASWHFSISLNGTLYQHYATSASCWASGNKTANTRFVAVESEGIAGTPLNDAQIATWLRLVNELGYATRGVDIFEHNEVAVMWTPNGGPTACPSHRYDKAFAELENDMADPRLDAVVAALTGFKGDDPNAMAVLNDWNKNGNSLLAGYTAEQQKLAGHLNNHPGSTTVTEHKHHPGGVIQ